MRNSKSEKLIIGRAGSAAGLRGEFRVNLYAADSANLKEGKNLLFRHSKENGASAGRDEFEAKCVSVRYQKDKPVIRVEGVDDRSAAEALRGMEIFIDENDLDELPEGEHYVRNLIGMTVRDISDASGGTDIGVLRDVIQNTAQSVLEVETREGRTVLIPAVDAFMRSIDEEEGLIEVELIPGFLD